MLGRAQTPPEEQAKPVSVHVDPVVMARAVVAASSALLRDDPKAAETALGQLEGACRRLNPEEGEALGKGFRNADQALHVVLANTTSYVRAGALDRAFNEFVWVQRTCRDCHALARKSGRLPADGPVWAESSGAANGAETARSEAPAP